MDDDDKFDELSDEQFAAIDLDVANSSRHEDEENDQNIANSTPEQALAPTQSQADVFAGVSEEQLAVLDGDVARMNNRKKQKINANQNDEADELFSEFTDDQFRALDQAVENINNRPERDRNLQQTIPNNNSQHLNENIVSTSELELAAAIFDDDYNEPTLEHLHCLRSKFNITQFRPKQWEIIDAIMNKGRDVSAVMATGSGKSLCFQFPAIYKNGIVLVICPLISLMQAQGNYS